ncbi:hypothetical protein KJZ71_01030 [Patescibacteria group bacterium]|uniref:dUTP diphosphatase n=1 Tax=candidate division WWE3 bacterium TaxID=2053526 RepID=A0A928TVY6_UNCKA|nr:hypothetical protein [candidate division WWE3 bacterium]MCL4732370.1 hypothetical protein [Patescibacteria group bacterium]
MDVRITKIDPRAVIPAYQTDGAAAFDLTIIEDAVIPSRGTAFLRTGLVFGIPEDHVLLIMARSSLFKKFGLTLANQVGVLDADYCGPEDECHIYLFNPQDTDVKVLAGSRLAQGIVLPRPRVTFVEGTAAERSRGGFGSTGGHG